MKIVIMGHSGSGKSTLARKLAKKHAVPVLHLDSVQFLPNWEVRPAEEKEKIVRDFLDENEEGWVIDGTYAKLSFDRRLQEADLIILMLFGRFACLFRCFRRYRTYKGSSRPDMAAGCDEKMDWEFVKWILWEGRSKAAMDRFRMIQRTYPEKVRVIRNQRQLDDASVI